MQPITLGQLSISFYGDVFGDCQSERLALRDTVVKRHKTRPVFFNPDDI
jgi:hypothetical protein